MTTSRDPDRLIRAFLSEGEEQLYDQVYDAVRAEIEHKGQRVVIGPWRMPIMNRIVGFGLAAAAVVAIVLIGSQVIGSPTPGGLGSGATPSPEASVAEPTAPEPSSTPEDRLLPEGPFVLYDGVAFGGPPITVTIPAPDWYSSPPGFVGVLQKNDRSDPPDGAGMIAPWVGELYVYGDPCQWSTTLPDAPATTVDEVVAALTAQASRDASAPVDITVDGSAGKAITLHVPDDADFTACDDGTFASWAGGEDSGSAGPSRSHKAGQIDEVWILDVNGELIVVDAMYGAETPAEHLDEVHAILESMTFGE